MGDISNEDRHPNQRGGRGQGDREGDQKQRHARIHRVAAIGKNPVGDEGGGRVEMDRVGRGFGAAEGSDRRDDHCYPAAKHRQRDDPPDQRRRV